MDRFQKVYSQGMVAVVEIWVDTETGVNYMFQRNGNGAGLTPLLDQEGKPIRPAISSNKPPFSRCKRENGGLLL